MRKSGFLLAVVGGAALTAVANTTAHGQTDRRWTGTSDINYGTTGNWSDSDVPNTTSEAILVDGNNNSQTRIELDITPVTVGQLRVVSPETTVRLQTARVNARVFTLSPGEFFDGIGIDMSAATTNFEISYYGESSNRLLDFGLGSSQEWRVTSSAAAGDLLFTAPSNQGNVPVVVQLGTHTLTANVGAGRKIDTSFGQFNSTTGGSLVKTGTGTLELRRPNSYNGNTTIRGGTVQLIGSGSFDNSPIITVGDAGSSGAVLSKLSGTFTVGSTQTLAGIGTVFGTVSIAAGGTLAPGDGVGTLTLNDNLTLADGGLLAFSLASIGASSMVSMPSATLTLDNQEWADFDFTPLAGFGAGVYTLIDAANISGSLGSNRFGSIGGLSGELFVDSGNSDLTLIVVPEPHAVALLLAGASLVAVGRRQSKRRAR